MKPIDEIFISFMSYISVDVSARLIEKEIDDFDSYIVGPPSDVKEKQLALYLGTDQEDPEYSTVSFMMQAQLPKVGDPIGYKTVIDASVKAYDPSKAGADSLGRKSVAFYPGEIKDGGMSSFIIYEITLEDELDDCGDD